MFNKIQTTFKIQPDLRSYIIMMDSFRYQNKVIIQSDDVSIKVGTDDQPHGSYEKRQRTSNSRFLLVCNFTSTEKEKST
jgi:hypothetical protein